jgi:GMP synthase (glutamine-hydrolysing)
MSHQKILILDFGSQVTQLIARRVREAKVFCEIHPYDVSDEFIRSYGAQGIILSGGPNSVTEGDTPRAPKVVFELGVPVLGICYGMQTMAQQLGGQVMTAEAAGKAREFGYSEVRAHGHTALLNDIADFTTAEGHGMLKVWMSHGDSVMELPPGFKTMASTPSCPIAAMADEERASSTPSSSIRKSRTRCRAGPSSNASCMASAAVAPTGSWATTSPKRWPRSAPRSAAMMSSSASPAVSIPSVAAALIHRAIGDQLTCVFVDHGLLRLNEGDMVMDMFARNLGVKVIRVDAVDDFMGKLAGVSDPEQKRKIIGKEFVEVFQAESKKLPAKWLAQGTIYPDVIESAGKGKKGAHTIKSHHNVGGLPEDMHLKLLEPLRELFKDEVRELGVALGLPREMVYRHPFPGPGLGVRILGEVTLKAAHLLQRADAIFIDELRSTVASERDVAAGACTEADIGKTWYDLTSQAFAVFLPVKSVGVMGDGRTYENVVALRAVVTSDFMTAHWAHLPYELLGRVSNRIINEVNRGVRREPGGRHRIRRNPSWHCARGFFWSGLPGKPPATIEWE